MCATITWSIKVSSGTVLLSDHQSVYIKIQLKCYHRKGLENGGERESQREKREETGKVLPAPSEEQ